MNTCKILCVWCIAHRVVQKILESNHVEKIKLRHDQIQCCVVFESFKGAYCLLELIGQSTNQTRQLCQPKRAAYKQIGHPSKTAPF